MAYGYSYGPPGEHQKAKEAEASSMDGEPRGYFVLVLIIMPLLVMVMMRNDDDDDDDDV